MKSLLLLPKNFALVTKQVLLSVGKRNDPALAGAISEFTTRLSRETDTSWHLIKPSGAEVLLARRDESEAVLSYIDDKDIVVLLDERGKMYSSEAFAETYQSLLTRSARIVFIIGGAYGVDERLQARADVTWSFSKLVFPHQIVRLLLVEQLYRAHMILKNHPYHHT